MRFRHPLRALARGWPRGVHWLMTLWLIVFSAHHAAPDAPIWYGGLAAHSAAHTEVEHAHDQGLDAPLEAMSGPDVAAFTASHDHAHGHCELCFGSAFQLPAALKAPLRPVRRASLPGIRLPGRALALDVALPDAHAPPRI